MLNAIQDTAWVHAQRFGENLLAARRLATFNAETLAQRAGLCFDRVLAIKADEAPKLMLSEMVMLASNVGSQVAELLRA